MTFKEKLMQDHPDWNESQVNAQVRQSCPSVYSYEQRKECPEEIDASFPDSCYKCWNREIPGTENIKKEDAVMATTRKTKDELREELKEAYIKIAELNRELNDAKEREKIQESADKVAQMRDAFVNAGFTKEEAFQLVRTTIEAALGGKMGR